MSGDGSSLESKERRERYGFTWSVDVVRVKLLPTVENAFNFAGYLTAHTRVKIFVSLIVIQNPPLFKHLWCMLSRVSLHSPIKREAAKPWKNINEIKISRFNGNIFLTFPRLSGNCHREIYNVYTYLRFDRVECNYFSVDLRIFCTMQSGSDPYTSKFDH